MIRAAGHETHDILPSITEWNEINIDVYETLKQIDSTNIECVRYECSGRLEPAIGVGRVLETTDKKLQIFGPEVDLKTDGRANGVKGRRGDAADGCYGGCA